MSDTPQQNTQSQSKSQEPVKSVTTYKIGSYILQIDGKYNYLVSAFQLTYSFGNIPVCLVDIAQQGCYHLTNLIDIPKINDFSQLIKNTSRIQGNLVRCKLLEWKTKTDQLCMFEGYVCTVSTFMKAGAKLEAGATCTCMAPPCALMYAAHLDYIYAPQSIVIDYQRLNFWGAAGVDTLLGTLYSNTQNITDLIDTSNINKASDTIADMLSKLFTCWTTYKKQKQLQPDFKQPKINIADYFQSEYILSKFAQKLTTGIDNAFVRALCQSFVGGLRNSTVYQSILFATGQKLLTVTPSKLGDTKLSIVPNTITPYQAGDDITKNNITSFNVALQPLRHLRTPNVLYVEMSKNSLYGTSYETNNRNIYGRYPADNTKIPKVAKVKVVKSPDWLLQWAVQAAHDTQRNTSYSQLYNIPQGENQKTVQQTPVRDIIRQNQNIKKLRDAYARATFFNMYLRDKQADLQLIVNYSNLTGLVPLLGKSILIQAPMTIQQASHGNASAYYGRLTSVAFTYTASTAPQQSSSLRIRCHVDGITPKQDSQFATFYTDKSNLIDNLYVKKN